MNVRGAACAVRSTKTRTAHRVNFSTSHSEPRTPHSSATAIDRAALCRIETGENGNPTVNTLLRYARAIGRKINVALVEADPVKA